MQSLFPTDIHLEEEIRSDHLQRCWPTGTLSPRWWYFPSDLPRRLLLVLLCQFTDFNEARSETRMIYCLLFHLRWIYFLRYACVSHLSLRSLSVYEIEYEPFINNDENDKRMTGSKYSFDRADTHTHAYISTSQRIDSYFISKYPDVVHFSLLSLSSFSLFFLSTVDRSMKRMWVSCIQT